LIGDSTLFAKNWEVSVVVWFINSEKRMQFRTLVAFTLFAIVAAASSTEKPVNKADKATDKPKTPTKPKPTKKPKTPTKPKPTKKPKPSKPETKKPVATKAPVKKD
jgi:outer membrane biosynthesis protein TonB